MAMPELHCRDCNAQVAEDNKSRSACENPCTVQVPVMGRVRFEVQVGGQGIPFEKDQVLHVQQA